MGTCQRIRDVSARGDSRWCGHGWVLGSHFESWLVESQSPKGDFRGSINLDDRCSS